VGPVALAGLVALLSAALAGATPASEAIDPWPLFDAVTARLRAHG